MDGVIAGLGGSTASVTTNPPAQTVSSTAHIFSNANYSLSSPNMAATVKIGSPVAATSVVTPASSPSMKASTPTGTPIGQPPVALPNTPMSSLRPSPSATASNIPKVLDKHRLQELVKEVDPLEQMDDDVEEMLMQVADDFIDNIVTAACQLAKHRKANTVEVKDVQLHLERNWNMWIPGFGSEELKPFKKSATTEAHKQRLALIKKTLKKY